MYFVPLILLLTAGAWVAWRHHPAYSAQTAMQTAFVLLLSLAALTGLIAADINFAMRKSPLLGAIILAGLIVFGTLALIFAILAVSTPKAARLEAKLPPLAKPIYFHRRRISKWVKFFVIFLALCGILFAVIPGDDRYVALVIGGMALFIAAIILPVTYVNARRLDVSLAALKCSPWLHWQYPPEQWEQWNNIQVERLEAAPAKVALKLDWRSLAWTFAAIAATIFFFYPGQWLADIVGVLICCGLLLVIVWGVPRESRREAEKVRFGLLKAAPEVYFGHDGVFCNGVYMTWLTSDIYLMAASLDERQPRSLLFRFEKAMSSPYAECTALPIRQSVLIPEGCDGDLVRLQKELEARCPKAQIALC